MSGNSQRLLQPFSPSSQAVHQQNHCMEKQQHPWRISEALQQAGFHQDLRQTPEASLCEEEIRNQGRIPVLPEDDRPF